ncbi:hypothetical protein RHECNPAF_4460094 [Rhizobium etli CNPAF512]|nr:hypothetical protein RHECNPAF_4460094 [Rhizobium etli CNPAF512]
MVMAPRLSIDPFQSAPFNWVAFSADVAPQLSPSPWRA